MSGVLSEVATRLRGYTVDETSPPKHSTCQVFYLKWLRGYLDTQWIRSKLEREIISEVATRLREYAVDEIKNRTRNNF